jgi:hypothetical protein
MGRIAELIFQRDGIRPGIGKQHRGDDCQVLNCPVLFARHLFILL